MRSSIGQKPSHRTHTDEEWPFVRRCVCVRALSAAGQRPQSGVALQAAVCFRCHGGVTARVSGLSGHGRDIIGRRGGGGGRGLGGAVDYCGTCAAKNTRQQIGFIETRRILPLSAESHMHV